MGTHTMDTHIVNTATIVDKTKVNNNVGALNGAARLTTIQSSTYLENSVVLAASPTFPKANAVSGTLSGSHTCTAHTTDLQSARAPSNVRTE